MKKLLLITIVCLVLALIGTDQSVKSVSIWDEPGEIKLNEEELSDAKMMLEEEKLNFESFDLNKIDNGFVFNYEKKIDSEDDKLLEFLFDDNRYETLIVESFIDFEKMVYTVDYIMVDEEGETIEESTIVYDLVYSVKDGYSEIYVITEDFVVPLSYHYQNDDLGNLGDIIESVNYDDTAASDYVGALAVAMVGVIVWIAVDSGAADHVTDEFVGMMQDLWASITNAINNVGFTNPVITTKYAVDIEGERYELKVMTTSIQSQLDNQLFFVALADFNTGLIWISEISISETMAIGIIAAEHWIKDFTDIHTLYFSTYTKNSEDAKRVARLAFGNEPYLSKAHGDGAPGYYRHYHAVTRYTANGFWVTGHAHSFFGTPTT